MRTPEHMRLRLGMTQKELADAAKISPFVISSIENGHRVPRASSIRKVAAALNVETTELWDAILAARDATTADAPPANGNTDE